MKKFEYKLVEPPLYNRCLSRTNNLLKEVAIYTNKKELSITPKDIILYFESIYDITFTFFDKDCSVRYIKFKHLVQKTKFITLHEKLVNQMSGVTIPENNHFVIMLNQTMPLSRIIFTILHELCHLHFHELEKNRRIFASKFSGKYPKKLMPFEDEANVTASLLFCPTTKLETLLTRNYSFNKIKSITNMSRKALHSRLLNYFFHIIGLNYKEALNLVLNYKEGNFQSSVNIKKLIDKKNGQETKLANFPIKISTGYELNYQNCINFLKRLSVNELVFELEYAHSTRNYSLEQLVMNEYYKKFS